DYEGYFEDTMRAGHYENRKESLLSRSDLVIIRICLSSRRFSAENAPPTPVPTITTSVLISNFIPPIPVLLAGHLLFLIFDFPVLLFCSKLQHFL
ncbi:MAG: hypothetical protein EGR13_05260, partial [Coprococcus comes]|nr:hypothetical protein [Coprococcus comes]